MELLLAVACDEAVERPDGKLDLVGIFNELYAPGFPAVQERMTLVFVLQWSPEEAGEQPLRIALVDESGQPVRIEGRPVALVEGHTEVDRREPHRAPAQTRLVLPLERVFFPRAGRYAFELLAGEEVRQAVPLFVAERPASD